MFGPYLDRHVSLERGGFEFQMESDLLLGIAQAEIERDAAAIAKKAVGTDITLRHGRRSVSGFQTYVDEEAPWHKEILAQIDLSGMPYRPSDEEIEIRLQREKFAQEMQIKKDVATVLAENNLENAHESVLEIVSKIAGTSKRRSYSLHRPPSTALLDIFCKKS